MKLDRVLQFGFSRRLPIILQAEAAECGMACLAMILGFHGHAIDLGTMRRRNAVSLKGATLRDLINLADALGLATRPLRLELVDLRKLRRPCILHWGLNHFVVLQSVGHGKITIHDPAVGRRVISMEEASREFTGVALEALPNERFVRADERHDLKLRHLFRNITGAGSSLVSILLLSLGIELIALLMPIGSQIIIDEVIVSADYDLLLTVGVGLAVFLVLQLVISAARTWAIMLVSTTINLQWNTGLFDHLTRLPLDFFEKRHIGDIISRFGSLATIQKALTTDLVQAVLDGLMSIGMVAMMFIYGGWLGWVAMIATALNACLRLLRYQPYRQSTEQAIVYDAKQQTHFIETVRGMASVKLLGLRDRRRSVWLNYLVDSINAKLRLQRLDLIFGRANELLFGADRLVMIILAAQMVMTNKMTVGMLVAFLSYKDQFATRVGSLIASWFQLRMLNVQTDRLADIVLAEQEAEGSGFAAPAIHDKPDLSGAALRAEDLSTRYGENEPWILRGADLDIPSGQSVAITGPSGCGKTTLLKVLMGLLAPTEGRVSIDGIDIRAIGGTAYRHQIAGVLQHDGLFAGSIADNICGFDPNPDRGWIDECASRAAILQDIQRMPMGLESLVGDMGSSLSGGQMQRVVLARALYRRPRILFLDEATSHLDETTETAIVAALRDLQMTRVIVAHRPATIANADLVIPFATLGVAHLSGTLHRSGVEREAKRPGSLPDRQA
ncbi:peptidase domain-containing ABC transporter [Rhizobium sp. P44RR-XXIV]|uniref:peptidase domain-containing ABC transporter n=1 Tax=Rhizobium sp. P44RR-XXIV TaxID=1921145 RepID=UPI000984ED49|nr:peptidase domain-containing ABC transporter [Rhizobium sp. P44RR-XXIV]TIX87245.1 peptidase domain-containing ABC transporter [Rhizobium sp. P44RR-XXIV]